MTQVLVKATNTIFEVFVIYAILLVLGAVGFAYFEQKSFGDGLWWAAVTATTTGYGDLSPATLPGRIVGFFLMNVTLLFVLPILITRMCGALIEDTHKFTDEEQRQLLADVAWIKERLSNEAS